MTSQDRSGTGNRPWMAAHLEAALDGLAVGLVTFDEKLAVLFTNAGLAATLELPPALQGGGRPLLDILHGSARLAGGMAQSVHKACLHAVNTGNKYISHLAIHSGQGVRTVALQILPLGNGHWMASFEDVAARNFTAAGADMRDKLTGLPDRQSFNERLMAALAEAAHRDALDDLSLGDAGRDGIWPAVLLVALDRFKAVNDTLGHLVGDNLLILVSRRLRAVLRQNDIVARLDGDRFALLLDSAPDPDSVSQLAGRIVDVLGRSYLIGGNLVNIGASVGIALASRNGPECGPVLRHAQLALDDAKASGRSTFRFFGPEMDVRALARHSLENDLRKAMALREFELHYQPQIDLETNMVIGFEALLRWRHPKRGLVSPGEFIALAEQTRLIVPLGEWVLREACCNAALWPGGVSVAVNVSPHQFEDTARLVDMVAQSLAHSGLPGHRLEIEVTESVLLRNEQAVLAALHRLHAMGVRVAMDDFGTGYSSLSQLHSFPFDKLKIDRSFVADRGDAPGQDAIIRAIIALGGTLGMATIAEGVETPGQLARVQAEGCTLAQGYLFSRPVPEGQVGLLIARFAGHRQPAAMTNV